MRILVDGLDMSGKTTLVATLIKTLETRGVTAVRHRGMLAEHHPIEPLLKRLPLVRQARSSAITAAFLVGGYALDGLLVHLDPPAPTDAVIIQDGYADRTIAFGLAGGPYLTAALALWASRVFATFDVAVYLHASPRVRGERMAERADVDEADRRSVQDEHFAARFNASLLNFVGRRHRTLLVFDTAEHTPEEIAEQVLAAAGVPALPTTERTYGRTA
ncbi:hypothetical protein [Kitasatospora cineracea]|uniref:dTMP kinase n=1 Tax=Kitasatospora cineracea TaxID=88074 RepID=A0A8G1UJS6_9ACTN|nr:hypothetical protein [Kitasatospora cineracea]ROR42992.1 dTMP kinase [Kitasatospora cineracea]